MVSQCVFIDSETMPTDLQPRAEWQGSYLTSSSMPKFPAQLSIACDRESGSGDISQPGEPFYGGGR